MVSNSLWPHELQHARLRCPHYLAEFAQTHVHSWLRDPTKVSSIAGRFLTIWAPRKPLVHLILKAEDLINGRFLQLQWSEVAQSCPTLCNPMDCSLPGSSVHGIFQARILEWVAISFSRRSSRPRDRTQVSRIVGRRFTVWVTREGYTEGGAKLE